MSQAEYPIISSKTSDYLRCKKEKPEIYMHDHEKGLIKRLKQKSCPKTLQIYYHVNVNGFEETNSI